MKKFLLLVIPTLVLAQQREFQSVKAAKDRIEVTVSDGLYQFKSYGPQIIETSFIPSGEQWNPASHAVVASAQKNLRLKQSKEALDIETGGVRVHIQKSPWNISYIYNGKTLLTEDHFARRDSVWSVDFKIDKNEALYGGGARAMSLNRRGNQLTLRNEPHYGYGAYEPTLNFCVPLILSSKMYAVHFDSPSIATLDLDSQKNDHMAYRSQTGRKTYQVIAGKNWPDLIDQYTNLTGKQPLPPRWALGNFASRFGYRSQEDVESIVRRFEQDSIPFDAVILDLYWFGKTIKGTMGNLDWDRDNFAEPQKMLDELNGKNIKTILITEPFVLTSSSKWKEADSQKALAVDATGKSAVYDFYFGNTSLLDVFKPEGQQWFWNVYKKFTQQGVGGWWGDLGEPEKMPSEIITAAGNGRDARNIYGHYWAKLVAEGYQKDFSNQRPFILMRAGYSGTQRYGIIPWSGDVSRSWSGLQSQPGIALGMGMQGIGYMHSDLGGFAGDYNDNELYLRWLQYGVFQPIFRPHAHEAVASEVARKDVVTKAAAKKLVELRYRMLPYNYNLAYENASKGLPLMRPLLFETPEKPAALNNTNTYLWGDAFLVTPILSAQAQTVKVDFPKGNWFDFYSDEKQTGDATKTVATAPDHIPVYVRGGSLIPLAPPLQRTAAYNLNQFELHYYFDADVASSSANLYQDDGQTPNAEAKGLYEKLAFSAKTAGNTVSLDLKQLQGGKFKASGKNIRLVLHNLSPRTAAVNGKSVTFKTVGNTVEIPVNWNPATIANIKLTI